MSEKTGLAAKWAELSERERYLLVGMGVWFALLVIGGGVYFFQQSMDETRTEIAGYKEALTTMAQYGPEYAANKAEAKSSAGKSQEKFTQEVMKKNKLALTSFVADHASAVDIKIDNYDENSLPKSTKKDGGPIINEKSLTIEIRMEEVSKMMALFDRIDKSKEPVIIKRINLRDVRKNPGKARATVTISTYTLEEPEG